MAQQKIISYNVNGIRAAQKKGFLDWLQAYQPDVLCLQESKAQPDQLDEKVLKPDGYHTFWYSAEKKGYSGVALFTKEEPQHVEYGMGVERFDAEGRVIRADFKDYSIISAYFPSGSSGDHRQAVKEDFLEAMYDYIGELRQKFPRLIISGDYNICHEARDIHDPVRNKKNSGFLPHEREWMSKFIGSGFLDSFRKFEEENGHYSWWSYRANARANNKGWRIDYHMVSDPIAENCVGAKILPEVKHSDHCPIEVIMQF
ncbi:MAG: exodeoxyribonuclease III [Bacteroidota bacterium]